jgi:hypothetical protein
VHHLSDKLSLGDFGGILRASGVMSLNVWSRLVVDDGLGEGSSCERRRFGSCTGKFEAE